MSFDPFAMIELWVVLAFGAAWLVLEWQGRRLDRLRDERTNGADAANSQASATHPMQETHVSPEVEHPPG